MPLPRSYSPAGGVIVYNKASHEATLTQYTLFYKALGSLITQEWCSPNPLAVPALGPLEPASWCRLTLLLLLTH